MKKMGLIVLLFVCVAVQGAEVVYENSVRVPRGDFPTESVDERDARMSWWRDAKFGMFVHWGLYSGLGGMWEGEYIKKRGREWIQCGVKADSETYRKAAVPKFNPTADFAEKWADLAKAAGCKYVVYTSKHHDGFTLHDSAVSEYDAGSILNRDLTKEIVEAVRSRGLKIGMYHSVIDWYHPQYDYETASHLPHPFAGKPSPNGTRNQDVYKKYLYDQVDELMTNYGKIDIIWWDFSRGNSQGDFWGAKDLIALIKEKQPNIISNNRLYRVHDPITGRNVKDEYAFYNPGHGDFTTPEQKVPRLPMSNLNWESCMTHNNSWGYNVMDKDYKSTKEVLEILCGVVGKGGNYLFNIGPKGDGSIPEETIKLMHEIGAWLNVNGEAIYGTEASPIIDLPYRGACTSKAGDLYLHLFEAPEAGTIDLGSLYAIQQAVWLDGDKQIPVQKKNGTYIIECGTTLPDTRCSVIKLQLN